MLSAVTRGSSLAPSLIASSQTVTAAVKNITPAFAPAAVKLKEDIKPEVLTSYSISKHISKGQLLNTSASRSIAGSSQMRYAHTDVQVPDFSYYRRESNKDPDKATQAGDASRKAFSYLMVGGGFGVPCIYGGKGLVTQFISSMSPSADVLAMAKIEVNLNDIPEGKNATFKWREKPLFIRHRTDDEIAAVQAVDVNELKDKQSDEERCKDSKWLICIGVCTHLGCIPVANAGWFGGYYCPCHGSHYDASGRIRHGPAPENLEVPEYTIDGDSVVVG